MFRSLLLVFMGLVSTQALLVVNHTDSIILTNEADNKRLFMGLADAMALDTQENFLYVIGSDTDMLNVIDVSVKTNLRVAHKQKFSEVSDGIARDVAVCRFSGLNEVARLAVSFSNRQPTYEGHVEVFDLLTRDNLQLVRREFIAVQPDPTSIIFNDNCEQIIVACAGEPGSRSNPPVMVDPVGHVDIIQLNPLGGSSIHKLNFAANNSFVRQVFNKYTDGNQGIANDLEPEVVVMGSNNTAYVVCQENNAIGGFIYTDTQSDIQLYDMGIKDFNLYDVDTSDRDASESPGNDGINLQRRNIQAFYQPRDMAVFQWNGEDYILTADTGAMKTLTAVEHAVDFTESKTGNSFDANELVSSTLGDTTVADLRQNSRLGRLQLSSLQQPLDGYDPIIYNRFTSLRMYGGRGFSIWRPSDLTQTYNSGGDFEFQMSLRYPSLFNGDISNGNLIPTAEMDRRSVLMGPEPTAIETGMVNNKRVVVIGSGRTGTLYVYQIQEDSSNVPVGVFQSIYRPGDVNANWNTLYNEGRAGHPRISDIEVVESSTGTDLYVLGSATGSVHVYSINDI